MLAKLKKVQSNNYLPSFQYWSASLRTIIAIVIKFQIKFHYAPNNVLTSMNQSVDQVNELHNSKKLDRFYNKETLPLLLM